jgi:hypothetical protein
MTQPATTKVATAMRPAQMIAPMVNFLVGSGAQRRPNRRPPRGPFICLPTWCGNRVKNAAARRRMAEIVPEYPYLRQLPRGPSKPRQDGHEAHCGCG